MTLLGAKSWSLDVQVEIVLRAMIGWVGILKWGMVGRYASMGAMT